MSDAVEDAAWNVVAMHGLRDGTATVMTSCEGVIVWLSPDAPRVAIPASVGGIPVRVGRRPAFQRSEEVADDGARETGRTDGAVTEDDHVG